MNKRLTYIWIIVAFFNVLGMQPSLRASGIEPLQDIVVTTVDGQVHTGQLIRLSQREGMTMQIGLDKQFHVVTADLIHISTSNHPRENRKRDAIIKTSNQDHIYGQFAEKGEDVVVLDTADLGKISIPMDRVVEIIPGGQDKRSHRRSKAWLQRMLPSSEDVALLSNGDTLRGFLVGVSAKRFVFETNDHELQLSLAHVLAIKLSNQRQEKPGKPHFTIRLGNSGRVTADRILWETNIINAHLQFGVDAQIEAERVVNLEIGGGRWQWLSDVEPISFEHTPMMSLGWHYSKNVNIVGGPMTVSLESYEHGIGVHARSVLKYDLKAAYREFVTSFGIDDDSGPLADVHVMILVDGSRRFEKENVRRGTLHGPLRMDVENAKTLELVVDFGLRGDIQDRFNWIDAALIR